ncbi:MAG: hypothetical protein ACT4QA_10090 [Panacagrimonas sp.]
MATRNGKPAARLLDRCALAFLSALSAFTVSALAWAAVAVVLGQFGVDWLPPFGWVIAFTALMSLLGFLLLENYVIDGVMGLLRWVLSLLRWV